jgi:hypothetical protein
MIKKSKKKLSLFQEKKKKSKKTGNLQIQLNSRLEKARSSFFKPKKFLAEKAEILWASPKFGLKPVISSQIQLKKFSVKNPQKK